jgi:hypothetical protein
MDSMSIFYPVTVMASSTALIIAEPTTSLEIGGTNSVLLDREADVETTRLLAQLLLEDVEEICASDKGKTRAGELSDQQYALELMRSDINNVSQVAEDVVLARSISEAVITDAECIERLRVEEQAAHDDRVYAAALSRHMVLPKKTVSQQNIEDNTFASSRYALRPLACDFDMSRVNSQTPISERLCSKTVL